MYLDVKNDIKKIEFEAVAEIKLCSGKKKSVVLKDDIYDTKDKNLKYSLVADNIKEELDVIGIPLKEINESLDKFSLSDICALTSVRTPNKPSVDKDMPFIISSYIDKESVIKKGKYGEETVEYYSYYKLKQSDTSCSGLVKDILSKYMNLDDIELYTSCGISAYFKTEVYRILKNKELQAITVELPLKDMFRGNTERAVENMLNRLKELMTDHFYRYNVNLPTITGEFTWTCESDIEKVLSYYKFEFAKQISAIMYKQCGLPIDK